MLRTSLRPSSVLSSCDQTSLCKPKKRVTILLPEKTRKENVSLISRTDQSSSTLNNISAQVKSMKYNAKCQLDELFPSLSSAINLIFAENTRYLLQSLSSTMIGDFIYNMRTLLFSPLLTTIQSLDIILFMIIKFHRSVSLVVKSEYLHQRWVELYEKCKNCEHQQWVEYIPDIRIEYIIMWCTFIRGDLGYPIIKK